MRVVLCKWTHGTIISNIKISRHTFVCYYSYNVWRNLKKISQRYIPYKVVVCLPKSNARFIKVGKQLAPKTIKTTGPLSVSDDG